MPRINRFFASFLLLTAEMIVVILLFLAAAVVFLLLVKYIFVDRERAFDQAVFALFDPVRRDGLTGVMVFFSILGGTQCMLPANILLTVYFLFIRKHTWYSIKVPAVALGSIAINRLLKNYFDRPRPLDPFLEPASGFSFPSGHAMTSVTFWGLIIYFVWRHVRHKILRAFIIALLLLVILLIGASRIYLRVHYPSDVIAGYCMGMVWLVLSLVLLNKTEASFKRSV